MAITDNGTNIHGDIKHDSTVFKMKFGNYAGNNTANRAIPHGLGKTPSWVFISDRNGNSFFIEPGLDSVIFVPDGIGYTTVQIDSTNFYVGHAVSYTNSGNMTGRTYDWLVIG